MILILSGCRKSNRERIRFESRVIMWKTINATYNPSSMGRFSILCEQRRRRVCLYLLWMRELWKQENSIYEMCDRRYNTTKTEEHLGRKIVGFFQLPRQHQISFLMHFFNASKLEHGFCVRLHLQFWLLMINSPFLFPKKRVCCAGLDHWREVLSLYSTRQVMFAVPPSVTVTFWTRGYWPLLPATRHTRGRGVRRRAR